jgi:Zn-dependent protease with chaperone function
VWGIMFNKKIIFLVLMSCIYSVQAQAKTLHNISEDSTSLDNLGTESLSAQNEAFIRAIQSEMKATQIKLTIRKMSDDAIALVGRENAFVVGGYDFLFVSEEWFNELTVSERRFLIGHELSHLIMEHSQKKMVVDQAMALLINYMWKLIGNDAQKGTWKHYGIDAAKKIGFGTIKILLLSMLSRSCEREADEISVEKLASAAGGIALFERMAHHTSKTPQSGFIAFVRRIVNCFASHPCHEERLAYLRLMVDKKN